VEVGADELAPDDPFDVPEAAGAVPEAAGAEAEPLEPPEDLPSAVFWKVVKSELEAGLMIMTMPREQ